MIKAFNLEQPEIPPTDDAYMAISANLTYSYDIIVMGFLGWTHHIQGAGAGVGVRERGGGRSCVQGRIGLASSYGVRVTNSRGRERVPLRMGVWLGRQVVLVAFFLSAFFTTRNQQCKTHKKKIGA